MFEELKNESIKYNIRRKLAKIKICEVIASKVWIK
jgi:hypothetical protein